MSNEISLRAFQIYVLALQGVTWTLHNASNAVFAWLMLALLGLSPSSAVASGSIQSQMFTPMQSGLCDVAKYNVNKKY